MKSLVTLEIPISILTQITEAITGLAADYRKVHAAELENYDLRRQDPTNKGRVFYQSDRDYYEAELKRQKAEEIEVI